MGVMTGLSVTVCEMYVDVCTHQILSKMVPLIMKRHGTRKAPCLFEHVTMGEYQLTAHLNEFQNLNVPVRHDIRNIGSCAQSADIDLGKFRSGRYCDRLHLNAAQAEDFYQR